MNQPIGQLPRLREDVVRRNRVYFSSKAQPKSQSVTTRRATSRSTSASKQVNLKEVSAVAEAPTNRKLIDPMVLNPYRHRRHNSNGPRLDSQTPERKQQQVIGSIRVKKTSDQSKLLTERQATEKEDLRQPSATLKRWLRTYIEDMNNQKTKKTKQPEKRLSRRELIDKLNGRGMFRHRGTHQILDCKVQLEPRQYFDGIEESCIIRTEEENPHELGSMASLLHLIGK